MQNDLEKSRLQYEIEGLRVGKIPICEDVIWGVEGREWKSSSITQDSLDRIHVQPLMEWTYSFTRYQHEIKSS